MTYTPCSSPFLSVAGLMLFTGAACAQTIHSPLAPYPLPAKAAETVTALAARSDVLVLGELHGTQEVPEITASLLPELDKMGYHALALEVYADQQSALTDWATGKSSQVPSFYEGPHSDGRGNIQMLTLVHMALAAPYHWKVICFDVASSRPGDTWRRRDAGMARNFSEQWQQVPNARVLAICGNLHARTTNHTATDEHLADLWPSFAASLQHTYPGKRVRSIDIEPQRGGFFNSGQVNALSGKLLSEVKTRHRPADDWDLELGLPFATPATFLPALPNSVSFPLDGLLIQSVRITGNHRVPTADIMRVVQSKPGQVFRHQMLQADLQAIYALNEFEGVGPFAVQKTSQGGIVITVPVEENPHPFVPALKKLLFVPLSKSQH